MLEGLCVLLAFMLVLWLISVAIKNAGLVDMGWTLGLVFLAWLYVNRVEGWPLRNGLLLGMVTVWGLRLFGHLLFRLIRDPREDKRYQKLRSDWKNSQLKFFGLFLFEALLDVVLAIPFFLIVLNPAQPFLFIEIVGIVVWIIGLAGEVVADEQLKKFKSDPQNKGKTCQIGLWNYSRHPNYFFEWLMWVGYFLFALGSPWGWTAVVSPLLMYYFLMKVSGVPMLEQQALLSRGEEYLRYQQTTSMFVPLPKRKLNHG